MLEVQVFCFFKCYEELRIICISALICHWQQSRTGVFHDEILIFKCCSINWPSTRSIMVSYISSLKKKTTKQPDTALTDKFQNPSQKLYFLSTVKTLFWKNSFLQVSIISLDVGLPSFSRFVRGKGSSSRRCILCLFWTQNFRLPTVTFL